jgi:hypothetical protein
LVKSADTFYRMIGVQFPYWRGKKLSLEEIEHALCEYQKYHTILAQFRKNTTVLGQRKWRTRTDLEDDVPCMQCHTLKFTDVLLCDLCNRALCREHIPEDHSAQYMYAEETWICPLCVRFETSAQQNFVGKRCMTTLNK